MATNNPWIEPIPNNMVWSNAILVARGMAPYGAVALGEMEQVCERLRARTSEPQAWWEEWSAMATRLEQRADACEAAGHVISAGNYYLRAGMYYFTAERFIHPGPDKRAMGVKSIDCQTKGILRRYPNVERVEVPFEADHKNKSLPALFMKSPHATSKAPTIVVFNGMDNCKEMSVLFAGLEFARHGWHTLAIDGPGQGEAEYDIPICGDYERAAHAVVDWIEKRRDLDKDRIAIWGVSLGGYYAPRAAAYEKRFKACIALSGPYQWEQIWDDLPELTRDTFRVRSHSSDEKQAKEKARSLTMVEAAPKITCPIFIVAGRQDRLVPPAQAEQLAKNVNGPMELMMVEDGGHNANNRPYRYRSRTADWLAGQFGLPRI